MKDYHLDKELEHSGSRRCPSTYTVEEEVFTAGFVCIHTIFPKKSCGSEHHRCVELKLWPTCDSSIRYLRLGKNSVEVESQIILPLDYQ